MAMIRCDVVDHVGWPGVSAIKATLDLVHPPFKLILRSIMSDARLRRVNKEIAGAPDSHFLLYVLSDLLCSPDCKNDKSSKINIDLIDNSPFHLRGSFDGPQDTPYEGGHFAIVRLPHHLPIPLLGTPAYE
jgi:hypothetical protein